MKLSKTKWYLPVLIKIVEEGVLKNDAAAVSVGPVIFLTKNYEEEKGTLLHELEHTNQWYAATLVSLVGILIISKLLGFTLSQSWPALFLACLVDMTCYAYSSRYRAWSEIPAYKTQLNFYKTNDGRDLFLEAAKELFNHYNLKLSLVKIEELLKKV